MSESQMIRKMRGFGFIIISAVMSFLMSSCGMIDDPEPDDCVLSYRVRFRYDRNMKFADAFAAEVEEVTLHLVGKDGKVVWRKTEKGDALAREGYAMDVDVAPGTYSLLAWCSSKEPDSFTAGYDGTHTGLQVHFGTEVKDDSSEHISREIDRLYHGFVADVEFPDVESGEFVYVLPLTKDTNHFVITLQQLSGEPIDHNLVEFDITDDNAHLACDNEPIKGRPLTYHKWYSTTVKADISTRADNSVFAGAIAELTTSRLLTDSDARLHIYRNDTGATIASIRLIDALLLVMGQENTRRLTKQQYLDYKDEYNLTFFLDENHRWLDGLLQIESWRVVYGDKELD